jgi:hypothetical protein
MTMAKTTAYVTNYFTIDFINKTICGSPASFKKASTGMGTIYEELIDKMHNHPDFKLEKAHSEKNPDKKTYAGLKYALMEDYIAIQPNADILRKKMELVKKSAKQSAESAYPIVKKWFLEEVGKDFNVEEAKKAVKDSKEKKILKEAQGVVELPVDSMCPSEN